jgi:hypothetical protein
VAASIKEEQPIGTAFSFQLTPNAGGASGIQFYFVSNPSDTTPFIAGTTISPDGLVEVTSTGVLRTAARIDRENPLATPNNLFVRLVNVNDNNDADLCIVLVNTIGVNDNPPSCSERVYRPLLPEDSAVNTVAQLLVFQDADTNSILPTVVASTAPAGLFALENGNQIRLKQAGVLDFDFGQREFNITVKLDDGVFVAFCDVLINVTDVNDNPPEFAQASFAFGAVLVSSGDW